MLISQEFSIIILSASIIGLTIACVSIILASYAAIKVVAMEKSTHTIQYVDPTIDKENEEFMKSATDWATSDEALEKQEELYREDLEDEMPFFAPTDSDKEKISF